MYSEIGAQVVSGARMRAKAAKILRGRAITFGVVVAYSSASLVKDEGKFVYLSTPYLSVS